MDRLELARKVVAEAMGTALLGNGHRDRLPSIYAERLSTDVGVQLLENSIATGAGLVALIRRSDRCPGARFNPVVTLADRRSCRWHQHPRCARLRPRPDRRRLRGRRRRQRDVRESRPVNISGHARSSGALWFSEVIATMGLLLVILGVVRSGKGHTAPFAVGGYIAAAYWFTSSTSFANPAVTIAARCRTRSPASNRPRCRRTSSPRSSAPPSPLPSAGSCTPPSTPTRSSSPTNPATEEPPWPRSPR
ncbi:MAG: hypothetical protein R2755_32935 [Acidimicrobiales bacterium]